MNRLNRHIWTHLGYVTALIQGKPRQCRLIKTNQHTCLVQPLSAHPSCVAMNQCHTKIIKRHYSKHQVYLEVTAADTTARKRFFRWLTEPMRHESQLAIGRLI